MTDDPIQQKITWHIYKAEMEKIYNNTRDLKISLLKKGKLARIFSVLIGYPVKIFLGTSSSGGIVQMISDSITQVETGSMNMSTNTTAAGSQCPSSPSLLWLVILTTILNIMALILVVTQDFFQFDTQVDKYYTAAAAIDSFSKTVKYQSYHIKGTEGDRLATLIEFQNLYNDIINNHSGVIHNVESFSVDNSPPDAMDDAESDERPSISRLVERPSISAERRTSVTPPSRVNAGRVAYMHTLLDKL